MKVGDLVKYQDSWAGENTKGAVGLILKLPSDLSRDFKEQDYTVYWLQGNYMSGPHGCMGKLLEVIK